ncbi:porin [Breoghania sp.]|uniref:porin n=1 Tax=Breoghania sp. TaxID=2065378 RepID=UPI002AAB3CDD|nr:porin [Breoghania sp.]
MTTKLVLAAAAAGMFTAAGAQAADLPVAPEPVNYVRVCDAYGSGFFYLPGTETCLRVSGGMRVEFRFRDFADDGNSNWGTRDGNATTTRARAYTRFDSRTATEYGLLRTYVDLWFTGDSGGSTTPTVTLKNGFIQFGGFTFGRVGNGFFDFYTGDAWGSMQDQGFSDHESTVFAYTYGFGNGVSASLSIEDATFSRGQLANGFDADGNVVDAFGGHKLPDLVANVRIDQGWGAAQVMGAVHQVNGGNTVQDSAVGWALGAGVTFNLPMIAPKDSVSFQAAYAQGAAQYVSSNLDLDGVVKGGNTVDTTTAWGIGGGFKHYWTSQLSSGFSASYASLEAYGRTYDVDQWSVQGNLAWQPVSGFLMGVELEYLNETYDRPSANLQDDDDLVGMFRVQRMF